MLWCGVLLDLCQRGEILGRPGLWDGWLVKQRDDDTTDLSLGQHHTGSRIHSSYNNSIRTQYKVNSRSVRGMFTSQQWDGLREREGGSRFRETTWPSIV